jgi:hypothetical protein
MPSGWRKREMVRHLPDIGADGTPFDTLLDLRDQSKLAGTWIQRRCLRAI